MGQDVKKTPELAEAMRQEVERLNDQLKLSDPRSEERLRRLSQQLADAGGRTKEAVRDLANRQPAESLPVPAAPISRRPRPRPRASAIPTRSPTTMPPCARASACCRMAIPRAP